MVFGVVDRGQFYLCYIPHTRLSNHPRLFPLFLRSLCNRGPNQQHSQPLLRLSQACLQAHLFTKQCLQLPLLRFTAHTFTTPLLEDLLVTLLCASTHYHHNNNKTPHLLVLLFSK